MLGLADLVVHQKLKGVLQAVPLQCAQCAICLQAGLRILEGCFLTTNHPKGGLMIQIIVHVLYESEILPDRSRRVDKSGTAPRTGAL